ncbi:MAG: XopF/Hpa4 family type III secretion system effector [Collimonas sp.]|uniref:XopF/Hpa4 family type III secretion system effector n=1 Tax=Collimonas sp. TaxID=1963772 RepID=UPI00326606AF
MPPVNRSSSIGNIPLQTQGETSTHAADVAAAKPSTPSSAKVARSQSAFVKEGPLRSLADIRRTQSLDHCVTAPVSRAPASPAPAITRQSSALSQPSGRFESTHWSGHPLMSQDSASIKRNAATPGVSSRFGEIPGNTEIVLDDAGDRMGLPASHFAASPSRVLLSPGVERSDSMYCNLDSSMRTQFNPSEFGVSSHFVNIPLHEASLDEVRIDMPERSPRELIASALDDIPWTEHAREGQPQHEAQNLLQGEYITWAADVLKSRQKAFGSAAYTLGKDMKAPTHDALLPALYEGVRQFISSASRSPLRNAMVTFLGPRNNKQGQRVGELANSFDPAVIGGAMGGLTAYTTDAWVLQAMDRRAKLSNFPAIKEVDVKALVPNPGPVRLRVKDGVKEYWRSASDQAGGHSSAFGQAGNLSLPRAGDATTVALKNDAIALRESLSRWQGNLDGKGLMTWFQPGVSGAVNVVRRLASTAHSLIKPLPVFGSSLLASASAGGAAKFTLGMAKATPGLAQAQVDNLIGGKQNINLFVVKAPDKDVPSANWGDIKGLPKVALDTAVEAGSLLKHSFNLSRPWTEMGGQAKDVVRVMLASATASVVAAATGQKLAEILRNGSPVPLSGETFKSGANLLQQFGQSTMNDYIWNATKDYTKNDAHDLSMSLDRNRDHKQQKLLIKAGQEHRKLPDLIEQWNTLLPPQPEMSRLGALIRTNPDRNIEVESIKTIRSGLGNNGGVPEANMSHEQQQAHAKLLNGLDTVIKLIATRDELVQWRNPAGASSADRTR